MRLALLHRPPGAAPSPSDAPVWRTCLRDMVFLRDWTGGDSSTVTDDEAYALLLEVVCGLRSPLAGETEVQAQFKAFLGSLDRDANGDLLRLGQRVLTDAKSIRAKYLQGVGVQAYGPLAARFVPAGRRVVLLGTGALARALAAALSAAHPLDRWGRKPDASANGGYHLLSSAADGLVRSSDPATLVVAAPVPAREIRAVATCYPGLSEIIDLRGGADRQPLEIPCRLIQLDDLFREARREGLAADRVAEARREIAALSRAFGRRDEIRPFGWDDLPAMSAW